MCCLKSTPLSFAISDGLVVTPSARPSAAPSRISLRLAVSRKNFITSSYAISENTDPRHFYFDHIAGVHARDACRRSSRNQVTGIQCHDLRDVSYKKGDSECHVSRVAFLF